MGNFELDLTSHLFYKLLLQFPLYFSIICVVGGLFFLFVFCEDFTMATLYKLVLVHFICTTAFYVIYVTSLPTKSPYAFLFVRRLSIPYKSPYSWNNHMIKEHFI